MTEQIARYGTPPPIKSTAFDHLKNAGDIADNALSNYHHLGYADRLNCLWEALLAVSNERIEYENTIGYQTAQEAVNG
jgi:hypothetical protein